MDRGELTSECDEHQQIREERDTLRQQLETLQRAQRLEQPMIELPDKHPLRIRAEAAEQQLAESIIALSRELDEARSTANNGIQLIAELRQQLAERTRALEHIRDADPDCQCEHDDEDCCALQPYGFCARCIAAVALGAHPPLPDTGGAMKRYQPETASERWAYEQGHKDAAYLQQTKDTP